MAGIYKWVDEQGNVHYSDKEQKGAKEVVLPKAVTYTPVPVKQEEETAEEVVDSGSGKQVQTYTGMNIVQPKMNETIRSNNGDVQVSIDLKPALGKGDSISLYLDGREVIKKGTSTSITLPALDRGSHTLRATVFNSQASAKISSRSVIFHLQRVAVSSTNNQPQNNSNAFTPNFGNTPSDNTSGDDGATNDGATDDAAADTDNDQDSGNQNPFQQGAQDFNRGIPSNSGTFAPGNNFNPNFNQNN